MFTTLNMIRDRLLAPAPVVVPPPLPVQAIQVPDPGIIFLDEDFGAITYLDDPPAPAIPVAGFRRNILTDDDVDSICQRQNTNHFTLSLVGQMTPYTSWLGLYLMIVDRCGTYTRWIAQEPKGPLEERHVAKHIIRNSFVDSLLVLILNRLSARYSVRSPDRGQRWTLPVLNCFYAPPTLDVGLPSYHEAFDSEVNMAYHLNNCFAQEHWSACLREIIKSSLGHLPTTSDSSWIKS